MAGTGFTVGRLPFLISMPYFHLDVGRGRFRAVEGSPAEINAALAAGRVHAAPSSSFEALRHSGLYSLIPEVCTSGFDSVGSARLFSAQRNGYTVQTGCVECVRMVQDLLRIDFHEIPSVPDELLSADVSRPAKGDIRA